MTRSMGMHVQGSWLAFLLALTACARPNASHCANNDGDNTCRARSVDFQVCNSCVAENDGCVSAIEDSKVERCHAATTGVADTGSGTDASASSSLGDSATGMSMTTMVSMSATESDSSGTSTDATGSGSSSGGEPECGNGIRELGELCDGSDLGDAVDCASVELGGGALGCAADCLTYDVSGCELEADCSNDVIEGNEQCAGENLDGANCESVGLVDGMLACDPVTCLFDTTACLTCGNDVADGDEQCDGDDLAAMDCTDFDFAGGALGCTQECTFNLNGCNSCGNNMIDVNEECDGAALNGEDCTTMGYISGPLGCSDLCLYDLSACEAGDDCPDGNIDGEEQCDTGDLGGATCMSVSPAFGGGILTCAGNCSFETDGCCLAPLQGCSSNADCCSRSCVLGALVCL